MSEHPIVFEAFTAGGLTATTTGSFALDIDAYDDFNGAVTDGAFLLDITAAAEEYAPIAVPPSVITVEGIFSFEIDALGSALEAGDTDLALFLGIDAAPGTSVDGGFELTIQAIESTADVSYGYFETLPADMTSSVGQVFEAIDDTANFTSSIAEDITLVFQSSADITSTVAFVGRLNLALASSAVLSDTFRFVLDSDFTDTATYTDVSTPTVRALLSLVDAAVAQDESVTLLDALLTVASGFVAGDALRFVMDTDLVDAATFDSELTERVRAVMLLLSEALFESDAQISAIVASDLVSSADFTVDSTALVAMLTELFDTADFSIRFSLPGSDGELHIGYAINLRTGGATTYNNFPFTGFATVGGIDFAVSEDGLYRLDGEDDDGAPIRARMRTGLTDYGNATLKHTPNVYVTLRTDGALLLKAITTDKGRKKENWYRLTPRQTPEPTENRFSIAKGLSGVYWGFEITNVDGSDFELDTIRAWPFLVQRRKSGR